MNMRICNRRQMLFSMLGTAFAFLIVFGGWWLTNHLLEKQETALFSVTGSINAPSPTNPVNPVSETIYPTLTESEIYMILNIWETSIDEIPHEPKAGQLTMEQAISAGKTGLSFFSEQGIIPSGLRVYNKINAYLCESKADPPQIIIAPQDLRYDDIRSREELVPFYSYWTVSFSSDQANAALVINAATGQIWKAKIEYPVTNVNLEKAEDKAIADDFMAYLGLKENTLFETIVQKSSTKINKDTSQLMLDVHLATKK